MRPIVISLILLVFSLSAGIATSAVYKHIADDGSVFYSDKPLKQGDKTYKSEEVMKFKAPKSESDNQNKTKTRSRYLGSTGEDEVQRVKKQQALRYESISIASPTDDSAIRSNDGNVTVQVSLVPALQTDFKHSLVIIMDGSEAKQSSGGSATFQNVERGTHQFSARVEDEKGNTLLQSSPISLHVQRVSVLGAKKAH